MGTRACAPAWRNHGINTAATLWATASLGLAVGAGSFVLTALAFGALMIVQFPLRWLETWIDRHSTGM